MKTFVRVQKHNGLAFWMQKTKSLVGDPIVQAVNRIRTTSSSEIGRQRRLDIHPDYLTDLCDFVGVPMDPRYYKNAVTATNIQRDRYTVSEFDTEDDSVNTKDLNDLELFKRAGKISFGHKPTKTFWDKLQ